MRATTKTDLRLEQFRQQHVGRLLAELHEDFTGRILRRLADETHSAVTPSQLEVLRSLPLEGARLTELSRRLGQTAQSAGARVQELIALGYLERARDPSDGRALRIGFSRRGRHLVELARTHITAIEDEYAERLGRRRYGALRASLAALVDVLGITIFP